MDQDFGQPITPLDEPKKNKAPIWVIVFIILLVVLCCCVAVAGGLWYLWVNGDSIFHITTQLPTLL
jgi:hypothetical protein